MNILDNTFSSVCVKYCTVVFLAEFAEFPESAVPCTDQLLIAGVSIFIVLQSHTTILLIISTLTKVENLLWLLNDSSQHYLNDFSN